MRTLIAFLTLFSSWGLANITWSSVETVFSSDTVNGSTPQLAVHPTNQSASIVWIGSAEGSAVYNSEFSMGSWSSPTVVSASENVQSSLQLSMDPSGIQTAVWDETIDADLWIYSSQNTGFGWLPSSPISSVNGIDASLHLSLSTPGINQAIITWQDSENRVNGASFISGNVSSTYFISQEGLAIEDSFISANTVPLLASNELLYYQVIDPLSPPSNPANTLLFPRIVNSTLFCACDKSIQETIFTFQDAKSLFLIAAIVNENEAEPIYTTVAIPRQLIIANEVAISPIDHLPVCIWETANGQIRTSYFNGQEWVSRIQLTPKGSLPKIAVNPVNNHYIAVWVDTNSHTVKVSESNKISWSPAISLSAPGVSITDLELSINTKGYAFVSWLRQETPDSKSVIEAVNGQ